MSDNVMEEAEVLAQFLRECELPTPPPPTSSCFQLPPQKNSSSSTGNSLVPLNGSFVLDEVDQNMLLEALDAYDMSTTLNSSGPPSMSSAKLPEDRNKLETGDESPHNLEMKAHKLSKQRANAARRRNKHRLKMKNEWQTLRLQNSELSAQLAALRYATGSVVEMKWQAIASKEMAARRQAEAQQQSIRTAIDRRAAVIARLQKGANGEHSQPHEDYEWKSDDFEMYKNFMLEINDAYERTDTVFNNCGLADAVPTCASFTKPIRRKDELRNIDYFESTSAFVLPCQYPKSANAMFDSMRQLHRQNPDRTMFEEVEDLPNTVAVKFGAIYHPKGGNSVPLGAVLVIHRFVEPGRTVLVWRCFIQGGNDFAGTFLHSINWCVLRRTTSDYTDVGMCIHLIPMHQNQNERSDGLEFSSIVLRSSNQDKLELTRLMQKLLLD